jgi:hypothetical protein
MMQYYVIKPWFFVLRLSGYLHLLVIFYKRLKHTLLLWVSRYDAFYIQASSLVASDNIPIVVSTRMTVQVLMTAQAVYSSRCRII